MHAQAALDVTPDAVSRIVAAATSRAPASLGPRRTSSTHEFYRYPARFAPDLARSLIDALTSPGDIVLDPFVGGGTTLVECRLAGRVGIGSDLNQLATFVTRVKCAVYSEETLEAVTKWAVRRLPLVTLKASVQIEDEWLTAGYLRNVDGPELWRLRKIIAVARAQINGLATKAQWEFVRCALLRTAQWALDMRPRLPSVPLFRDALGANIRGMVDAARDYARQVRRMDRTVPTKHPRRTVVIDSSAQNLRENLRIATYGAPRLVLTSPPYPGVYVNYHRWKLRSRLETPMPYWIANQLDGHGLAYYTMRARIRKYGEHVEYFGELLEAFSAIAALCDKDTVVAQVVGFSAPNVQVPVYLDTMHDAGFEEVLLPCDAKGEDGRLWRSVPGRRWWTKANGEATAREVLMFHRLRSPRRDRVERAEDASAADDRVGGTPHHADT